MEVRLNKLLGTAGICSRREADEWIAAGRVTVNGKTASVGDKVSEKDTVEVDGEIVRFPKSLYNNSLDLFGKESAVNRKNIPAKSASLRTTSRNNPENRANRKLWKKDSEQNRWKQ